MPGMSAVMTAFSKICQEMYIKIVYYHYHCFIYLLYNDKSLFQNAALLMKHKLVERACRSPVDLHVARCDNTVSVLGQGHT